MQMTIYKCLTSWAPKRCGHQRFGLLIRVRLICVSKMPHVGRQNVVENLWGRGSRGNVGHAAATG